LLLTTHGVSLVGAAHAPPSRHQTEPVRGRRAPSSACATLAHGFAVHGRPALVSPSRPAGDAPPAPTPPSTAHPPPPPPPPPRTPPPARGGRARGLHLGHPDEWAPPVFVERTARGRARTQAASAARWRDYDAAARTHFLRWVVSQRWQKASPTARRAVVAQLN